MKKSYKRILSLLLCATMVLNLTFVNFGEDNNVRESQSMIEKQLIEDLGEEKAEEIINNSEVIDIDESNVDSENNDDFFNEETEEEIEEEKEEKQESEDEEFELEEDDETDKEQEIESNEIEESESIDEESNSDLDEELIGDEETERVIASEEASKNIDNNENEQDIEDICTISEISIDNIEDCLLTENNILMNPVKNNLFGGFFDAYECYWYIDDDTIHFANSETDGYLDADDELKGNFSAIGSYITEPSIDLRENIYTAVFEENIKTMICSSWFKGYTNLTEIIGIDKLNTTSCTTMQMMFHGCENLKTLDLSTFETSSCTNMDMMFYDCNNLESINLSSFNTENVTTMSCMFYGCYKIEELDLSKFDTSNVTTMGEMFSKCNSLKILDMTNFNTSNVTTMIEMFYGCSSLEEIDVSMFDTSNVQYMDRIFHGCSSLKLLDISNFNTSKVEVWGATTLSGYFSNCSNLESIKFGNFSTKKIDNFSNMFYGCEKLQSLDLSNFDTGEVANMSRMFYGCSSLKTLDLSNFNTSKVTSLSYMFENCSNLRKILTLKSFDISLVKATTRVFKGCDNLIGGNGTLYNSSNVGKEYAIIDGENGNHGYFTNKLDDNKSIIIYHLYDGSFVDGYIASTSVTKGNRIILPTADNIILNDFKLVGWYDNDKLEGEPISKIQCCEEDIYNFYAKYEVSNKGMIGKWYITSTGQFYMVKPSYAIPSSASQHGNLYANYGDEPLPWETYKNQIKYVYCHNTTIAISSSELNSVSEINMSHWFDGCINLQSINISYLGINVKNISINMSYLCNGCSKLSGNISLPKHPKIVNMDYAFCGCTKLRSIAHSTSDGLHFVFTGNKGLNHTFDSCASLKFCKFFNYDLTNYTGSIDLSGCTNLYYIRASAEVINKLKESNAIGEWWNFDTGIKTNISKIDNNSIKLFRYYEPGVNAIYHYISSDGTLHAQTTKPTAKEYVEGHYMLNDGTQHGSKITSYSGISHVIFDCKINLYSASYLFDGMSDLTVVENLNYLDTSNSTDMSYMFEYCSSLTELDLSSFDVSNVTSMTYMFEGCTSLRTIYASYSWANDNINDYTIFGDCNLLVGSKGTSLQSIIDLGNYDSEHGKYARIDGDNGKAGYFTYKAKDDVMKVKITYYLNEGSFISGFTATTSVIQGKSLVLPTKDKVKYDGYKFAGWYDNDKFNGEPITKIDSCIKDTYSFYAKWEMLDSDEDGLYDAWEIYGVVYIPESNEYRIASKNDYNDANFVDLPAMGADPYKKDIFVEIDYMANDEKSCKPSSSALKIVYEQFNKSRYKINGIEKGINLHIDCGNNSIDYVTGKKWGKMSGSNEIEYKNNLILGENLENWVEIVNKNFEINRSGIFRHCMFIEHYDNCNSSGIAMDIPSQCFICALMYGQNKYTVAGTFMHELGHTLGLTHGGHDDDHMRYKPNHLSIMNYTYQFNCLYDSKDINYSEYELPSIDMKHINENNGIDPNSIIDNKIKGFIYSIFKDEELGRDNGNYKQIVYEGNPSGKKIDFNINGKYETDYNYVINAEEYFYNSNILGNVNNEWNMINIKGNFIDGKGVDINNEYKRHDEYECITEEEAIANNWENNNNCSIEQIYIDGDINEKSDNNIVVEVGNWCHFESKPTLQVESEMLNNTYNKTITVPANIGSEQKTTEIKIPLKNNLKEGTYEVKVILNKGIDYEVQIEQSYVITGKEKNSENKVDKNGNSYSGGGSSGGGGGGGGGGTAMTKTIFAVSPQKANAKTIKSRTIDINLNSQNIDWKQNIDGAWQLLIDKNNPSLIASNGFYNVMYTDYLTMMPYCRVYCFDNEGKMCNTWCKDELGNYYLFEWAKTSEEGKMITGWKQVNDKWYYFNIDGKLSVNTVTPDGYMVNAEGEWIELY